MPHLLQVNIPTKKLIRILLEWPTSTDDPNLTPYVQKKDELSLQIGVVVPPNLRPRIMSELHSSLAGSSCMKELT